MEEPEIVALESCQRLPKAAACIAIWDLAERRTAAEFVHKLHAIAAYNQFFPLLGM